MDATDNELKLIVRMRQSENIDDRTMGCFLFQQLKTMDKELTIQMVFPLTPLYYKQVTTGRWQSYIDYVLWYFSDPTNE